MTKIVGITGGIGSGKTLVCQIFKSFSVPVFHADDEAKACYSDPIIIEQVKSLFGKDIYQNSFIDREKLASIIFADSKKLQALNQIIHPAVGIRFDKWLNEQKSPYVLKEAAILFESGSYVDCDKVIVVTAPKAIRVERVLARDNVSRDQVESRMQHQWSDERKVAKGDYTILNDGLTTLVPQVDSIHKALINPKD